MAVRTLAMAKGNDAMFTPGHPVKIDRQEVEALIGECMRDCRDDDTLRRRFRTLAVSDAMLESGPIKIAGARAAQE